MIFDRKLGILTTEDPNPDIAEFIRAVQDVFSLTERLLVFPPKLARSLGLSVWKDMYAAWDTVFKVGKCDHQLKMHKY